MVVRTPLFKPTGWTKTRTILSSHIRTNIEPTNECSDSSIAYALILTALVYWAISINTFMWCCVGQLNYVFRVSAFCCCCIKNNKTILNLLCTGE